MDRMAHLEKLEKLWAESWPEGLARELDYPLGETPMIGYLRKWARETPDKACLIYYGAEITFSQLDDYSDRFAAYLSGNGLEKGDRVAVFLPNCPQFLIAFYGILKLGCIHVPVNPLFKETEFIYEIQYDVAADFRTGSSNFPLISFLSESIFCLHSARTKTPFFSLPGIKF